MSCGGKETEIGSGVGKLTVRGPGVGKVAVVCVGGGKVAVGDPGDSIFFHFTILQPNSTSHRRVKYYERYCYNTFARCTDELQVMQTWLTCLEND